MDYSNLYAQSLSGFPEGLFSLISNGQFPSIAGGDSSGYGAQQQAQAPMMSAIQQAMGGLNKQQQSQQSAVQQAQQALARAPQAQMSPFQQIQLRGMLPVQASGGMNPYLTNGAHP